MSQRKAVGTLVEVCIQKLVFEKCIMYMLVTNNRTVTRNIFRISIEASQLHLCVGIYCWGARMRSWRGWIN